MNRFGAVLFVLAVSGSLTFLANAADHQAQGFHLTPGQFGLLTLSANASDHPDCSQNDITGFSEVITKYQGMKGTNPSVPSTYNLIGKHKFNGGNWGFSNPFFGENWYPIRTEKEMLTGTVYRFSASDIDGDENDWNIFILPDSGFEAFVADAIPYRRDNWYGSADWDVTSDGKILIEAEITPDQTRYGNPWFNNNDRTSSLVNKKVTVYGPFVREEAHGNHPEIHPSEQIWWKEGDDVLMVLLVADDSNRFTKLGSYQTINGRREYVGGHFSVRRVTTPDFKPWAIEKGQEAELHVAFEVDPTKNGLAMSVQAIDSLNFYSGASFPDQSDAAKITLKDRGKVVLSVQEEPDIDPYVGVTFQDVCYNKEKNQLQGYVVLKTAIGKGDGKEGFVALRIDREPAGVATLLTGDILNSWKAHANYDDDILFTGDIISSDKYGNGIVHGFLDFDGNGKTDLFTIVNNEWMVLYDGKGKWQPLNTSSAPRSALRFGDVNGDRVTDVLRVDSRKLQVSYGGTARWTKIADVGNTYYIQVGDFNGDGSTDCVYIKHRYRQKQTDPLLADMYVSYGCKGSWKELNNQYHLDSNDDYSKNFRFGDFNGDGITDLFRHNKGRFGVYWNGTGDFREIFRPGFKLKTEDLLFVDRLTTKQTDVIFVDRATKKWTVFYGGKAGSLPLTIKYADPVQIGFGDLDADPAAEPYTVEQRRSPVDIPITFQAKAEIKPTILARYVPGSLKRTQSGDKSLLSIAMNVTGYPGGGPVPLAKKHLPSITSIKERAGSKALSFTRPPAQLPSPNGARILARIDQVPLSPGAKNHVQLSFAGQPAPRNFGIPSHGITAELDRVEETLGGTGEWNSWKPFLLASAKPGESEVFALPPSSPARIKTVKFEILPIYSAIERGKVRLVEMDDLASEFNDIAYGTDKTRLSEIFGDEKVFEITWQFELKNMVTGQTLPIANAPSLASDGKWSRNKVTFTFPQSPDLLRFRAVAMIKDRIGNGSPQPLDFVFWSQRINLTDPDRQLTDWLKPTKGSATNFEQLVTRAKFLAEDNVLTPAEIDSLFY